MFNSDISFDTLRSPESLGSLRSYLDLTGWQAENRGNWYEFTKEVGGDPDPFLIVLPVNPLSADAMDYIQKAIDLLAGLDDEPVEITIQRVIGYLADCILVRSLSASEESIQLSAAHREIRFLRQIVNTSARLERSPIPFFPSGGTGGKQYDISERFQFGHTFRGSFGFTLQSPVLRNQEALLYGVDKRGQGMLDNSLEAELGNTVYVPPLERRVVERIARGLAATHRATALNQADPIVESYKTGFNANACTILKSLTVEDEPIEFTFLWSPRVPQPVDLAEIAPIKITDDSDAVLEVANMELRKREPDWVRIEGTVTHLASSENPNLEADTGRHVVVRCPRPGGNRVINVEVPLGREDYIVADKAHFAWSTVRVEGILILASGAYRLANVRSFEVIRE